MAQGLSIKAVGDIAFAGRLADQPDLAVLAAIRPQLQDAHLVIGNLECPLLENGQPQMGKCCLKGSSGWAPILKDTGFHIVSLANNHLMDFGPEGLRQTMAILDQTGIAHLGAGENEFSARAPLFLEKNGQRIALLARSSVEVRSPCYATADMAGIAWLEEEELCASIRLCQEKADLVILLIHWGMEHYSYPSPRQRTLAKKIVEAGADLLIGHHPHVLQGSEIIGNGLAAYSLGNFLFDSLTWSLPLPSGETKRLTVPLSPESRQGIILEIDWEKGKPPTFKPRFTQITEGAAVEADPRPDRMRQWQNLNKRLTMPGYGLWWPLFSLGREWRLRLSGRAGGQSTLRKLSKLRLRHLLELKTILAKACRIATGKSTNPYE